MYDKSSSGRQEIYNIGRGVDVLVITTLPHLVIYPNLIATYTNSFVGATDCDREPEGNLTMA